MSPSWSWLAPLHKAMSFSLSKYDSKVYASNSAKSFWGTETVATYSTVSEWRFLGEQLHTEPCLHLWPTSEQKPLTWPPASRCWHCRGLKASAALFQDRSQCRLSLWRRKAGSFTETARERQHCPAGGFFRCCIWDGHTCGLSWDRTCYSG